MSGQDSIPVVSETFEMEPSSSDPVSTVTSTPSTPLLSRAGKKKTKKCTDKNDPHRFEGSGINFNGKFIGFDEIPDAKGDKLCQEKIQHLKALKRSSGIHKQRIIINVSVEGIKVIDQRTEVVEYTHPVHKVSFISHDTTDSRAFGYVYSEFDDSHKFYAIKTEKAADQLVLTLRDLFQVVYELKKTEVDEIKKREGDETTTDTSTVQGDEESKPNKEQEMITRQSVEEEKIPNLLDLENELQTIEQGIQQINTLENLFGSVDDRTTGSSDSPSLNISPSSVVQQAIIPGVPSGQGLLQTNPWASVHDSSNPFGGLSEQPTDVGLMMTTRSTNPFTSTVTFGGTVTASSDMFGSLANTTVNTGSLITADLFADIVSSSSMFGSSEISTPATSTNLSENCSFVIKQPSVTMGLHNPIGVGQNQNENPGLLAASTITVTQSSNLSDIFSGHSPQHVRIPGQGLFVAATVAPAHSSNLSDIFGRHSPPRVQTPGLTGPVQAMGQPGFSISDIQQQTLAQKISSLTGLSGETPCVAFSQPVTQQLSKPVFGQSQTSNSEFARMPFGVESTTVQTSSQPFPHIAGTGILQTGPFYAQNQKNVPHPSMTITQTENMHITSLSQNPFQSAQPTVQFMPNFFSQQGGQQSDKCPSPVFGSALSNPSVSTFPQKLGVNTYDALKLEGGSAITAVPMRQSVSLPVTKNPFADDPFSNAPSRHTADVMSVSSVFTSPDVRPSSWSDFSNDNAQEHAFWQTASTVKNNEPSNPNNRENFSNSPDLFSDLCAIGKKVDVEKPVKNMFSENIPKKTLNQLRTNSPTTITRQQQASHNDFFLPSLHNHPTSDFIPASGHNVSESHNVYPRPASILACNDPSSTFDERLSEKNFLKESSLGGLSSSSVDFNLPSPDEPPPPLPSHIEFLNNISALSPRLPAITANKHSKLITSSTQHASSSHSVSNCSKYMFDRTAEIISIPRLKCMDCFK